MRRFPHPWTVEAIDGGLQGHRLKWTVYLPMCTVTPISAMLKPLRADA